MSSACCMLMCGVVQLYLDAWKYVKGLLATAEGDSPALPAVKELVENWTSPEFEVFVETLAGIVDK